MEEFILELKNISKSFSGQRVLNGLSLNVKKGEVHAIVGKNGAGKTTLMKILVGLMEVDQGEVRLQGKIVNSNYRNKDITGIFPHTHLFPSMTVVENLYIGSKWPGWNKWYAYPRWSVIEKEATQIFRSFNINIDIHSKIDSLSIYQKKMVELAKALSSKSQVLILDEFTSDLDVKESNHFLKVIKSLKSFGLTILFITHNFDELIKIANTVSVIQDGRIIKTGASDIFSIQSIIHTLTKKPVASPYPKIQSKLFGKEILNVQGLTDNLSLTNVSFQLRQREIIGLTGFADSGCGAVGEAIFGMCPISGGTIIVNKKKLDKISPLDAISNQISYYPKDRNKSLANSMGVDQNITLSNLKTVSTKGLIDLNLENKISEDYIRRLGIQGTNVKQRVEYLSSGIRQKIMIAKSMLSRAKIHIFDEPTKGIDITSKVEVYNIMNDIILRQGSVIIISSDFDELIGMCDRILVMYRGVIIKELQGSDLNARSIMYYSSGGN